MKRTAIILIIFGILALSLTGTGCNEEEITSSPSPAQAALFLTVTQPLDGAQVSTSSILVAGTTNPGAVVSVLVNDKVTIADVDQNGAFSVAGSLEEGPNFIEVIASDQEGSEKSSTIAVIYVP